MKKVFKYTAFASALLVTPFALAEVTISGTVDQAYERFITKTNPTNAALGPYSSSVNGSENVNRIASTLANYNSLSFKGNEDLGNGLKATYEISFKNTGPDNPDVVVANYLSHVGIEGGFGKLKLGSQWRPLFTAVAAIDPTQLASTPGFVGAGKNGTGLSGLAPDPNPNSLTYNLPNIIPGLFIQAQKGLGEAATAATAGQGDNHGLFVIFTDGQNFYAAFAKHSQKMTARSFLAASATGTNGLGTAVILPAAVAGADLTLPQLTVAGLNGLDHRLYTATGGETRDSQGYAGSYNFGPAKLVFGTVTEDVAGTQAKLSMNAWGVKVPVSDNVDFGYLSTKANHTRSTGTQFSLSGYKMLATYGFSKRTKAYFAKGTQKLDGGTSAGNEFSTAITSVGLNHSF